MLPILCFVWAVGVVFHQTHFQRVDGWVYVVLNLATVLVLLRPSSVPRFLLLTAAHLVCFTWQLPIVVNHWIMLAFGDLALLAALLGRVPRSGEEWFQRFAPLLRAQLVVVYAFAVLHKVNVDYFDPELSCGASHLVKLASKLPLLPTADWAKLVSIYGVLAIEVALPVFLLLSRTRYAAIVAGTVFHFVLGLNGYHDFSAIAVPFYLAFLPADFPGRLRALCDRNGPVRALAARVAALANSRAADVSAVAAVLAAAAIPTVFGLGSKGRYLAFHVPFHALWVGYALGLIAVLWACRKPRPTPREPSDAVPPPPTPSPAPARAAGAAVMALVVFNGACPYLGLKTESSFAMFSNLQTEGEAWNHLFMPPSLKVFRWQDDLVAIETASEPAITRLTENGRQIVWLEFQRHLRYYPDAAVAYRRGGVVRRVARVGDDPELSSTRHPVASKLMWFRSVAPPGQNRCRH